MKSKFELKWETFLIFLFLLILLTFGITTRHFFYYRNIFDMTFIFVEKAIVALIMTYIIMTGNIDLSVASVMAFSSSVMGVAMQAGVPAWISVIIALLVGSACGLLNGLVITKFNLPAMIVTLATFTFYRGLAYVILGDQAVSGLSKQFQFIGRGYIPGTPIPFSLLFFILLSVIAGIILHKTRLGRMIHAMGLNSRACVASGLPVAKITLSLFFISGLVSAIAGVFLSSRIGTIRPNLATGFEIEIITIVILGGVVMTGGKGEMWAVVLTTFFIGTLRYGLGLNNVPGQYMLVITGSLLIISIISNNVISEYKRRKQLSQM